jgi:amino acid transporter
MSALSWQAGNASGSFLTGSMIQALIIINNPNYDPTNWQETLLIFANVVVLFSANVFGAKRLPLGQNLLLVLHCAGFLVVIIVLWVMAPHNSAHTVFTQFTNEGGWSSIGVSLMIGQITAIYSSVGTSNELYVRITDQSNTFSSGSDAPAHMAEEVKDAGLNVPNAMVWSYVLNGILAMIILVTYLFALPSVDDALDDPTYFPVSASFLILSPPD